MRKFMRTRAPPAGPAPPSPPAPAAPDPHLHANGHAHKANGNTNGGASGARRDDHHSTLSRYWSGSEGSGGLWEDPHFPAEGRALGDKRLARGVRWMRPHELCARPRFRGDEEAAGDSAQSADEPDDVFAARWCIEVGEAGDAHVCCAAAALALTPRLLERVAPPQSFRSHYTGTFRFRFWVFGAWREVSVDDRLPTRSGRALASRCALPDDFTLPLLEKAYAKLYGSYAALRGGSAARALQDLSGGIVQSFSLRHQPRALTFRVLNSAVPRSTLLVATVAPDKEGRRRLRGGLASGQAYCVTGLARVRAGAGAAAGALVRLRAPGGRGAWAGAWSPASAEWRALAAADRELLAARAAGPGDFWMSFDDFWHSFDRLELVHVGPDDWLGEPALHARRPWRAVLARRRWRTGYNAGGPPAAGGRGPRAGTAAANPQFHVQIPRSEAGARECHVVVSVTQQYAAGGGGERLRAIGFAVYELPAAASPRRAADPALLARLRPLDVTHESRAREVATFFTLPAGRYLVMPHTRRAHTDAAFLLRILTDDHTDVWEVNEDNVVIRDVPAEFLDDPHTIPAEIRATVAKWMEGRESEEVEAAALRGVLRGAWRARPSAELCRALVALRDPRLAGSARARDVPALAALLAHWRAAFLLHAARCGRRACSYRLRALLRAAGLAASNKVLEGLVLRYASRAALTADAFALALARLHLAHERYRSLDAKMKSNPISLEEMILMTIYS